MLVLQSAVFSQPFGRSVQLQQATFPAFFLSSQMSENDRWGGFAAQLAKSLCGKSTRHLIHMYLRCFFGVRNILSDERVFCMPYVISKLHVLVTVYFNNRVYCPRARGFPQPDSGMLHPQNLPLIPISRFLPSPSK